jgi:hypothetical protein
MGIFPSHVLFFFCLPGLGTGRALKVHAINGDVRWQCAKVSNGISHVFRLDHRGKVGEVRTGLFDYVCSNAAGADGVDANIVVAPFFESQKTYGVGELFEKGGVPEGYFETPEGEPAVRTQGKDLTLITLGPVLYSGMSVVEEMKEKYGMEVELIDLRFVNPLNYDKLVESVKKTGRVVLAGDSVERGSALHNVASNLTNLCFDYLDAPPVVIGAKNWISPAAEMEKDYFPQAEWMIDAIHERVVPLPGHVVKQNYTNGELQRITRLGV